MSDKSAVMNVRQSAELDFALERNRWTADDVKKLSTGDMLAKILPVIYGRAEIVVPKQIGPPLDVPVVLKIDRIKPFNPAEFIGKGWSFWRGPKNGKGLKGEEEQDKRSLAITELDPASLLNLTGLKKGEDYISGEEKLARLIVKAIPLDAKIGQTLYEEEGQKTLRWLHQALGVGRLEFLGTTLRLSHGDRCALCLCRRGDGSWDWRCPWLGHNRSSGNHALCIASISPKA